MFNISQNAHRVALTAAAMLVALLTACNRSEPIPPGEKIHDHGHAHHDHGDVGPHGGHLVELFGPEAYHAEWLHEDDTGVVTVYVLDEQAADEVPIEAGQITIETQVEGQEPRSYTLTAVNPSDGRTAQFQIQDKELLTALKVGEGVEATLSIPIDGQTYTAPIEHHHHEGHHHH